MKRKLLIYPGSGLKAVTTDSDGPMILEGYLVKFTDASRPDRSGARDYFDASTDFGYDELAEGKSVTLPAFYDHGLDPTIKRERIGSAEVKTDDVGVFARYTIRRRKEYLAAILKEDSKALGQSSGAVAHLVDRKSMGASNHVTMWTLGEASITPTPAEPSTDLYQVKSIEVHEWQDAELKAESLTARIQAIHHAAHQLGRSGHPYDESVWAVEIWDDYVVLETDGKGDGLGRIYQRASYTVSDGAIEFAPRSEWTTVRREVVYTDTAKAINDAIKATASDPRATTHEPSDLLKSIAKLNADFAHLSDAHQLRSVNALFA